MGKEQLDGLIAVVPGSPALFTFYGISRSALPDNFVASRVKLTPPLDFDSSEISPWGDANDFPDKLREETTKSAFALSLLEDYLLPIHYGIGIIPFIKESTEKGKFQITPYMDDQIRTFFKYSNINRLQKQIIGDYEWMRNYFPALVMDKTGKKIGYAKAFSPWDSRFAKMDKSDGQIKKLFLSANWPNPATEEMTEVPVLDYDLPAVDLLNQKPKPGDTFILRTQLLLRGKKYYDEAPWHALLTTWLPIANSVPAIKKAIINNQMTLKYHVKIPESFFDKKAKKQYNKGWDQISGQEQVKLMKEIIDFFNEYFAKVEASGSSLITRYSSNKDGKPVDDFIIDVIDSKIMDGQGLADNFQANMEIAQGMGFSPSLIGRTKGGSEQGSGSGMDSSMTIKQSLLRVRRESTLQWLYFVKEFNGWNPDVEFMYGDVDVSQNMDENPTGKQTVIRA